jgi:hypothetical protein
MRVYQLHGELKMENKKPYYVLFQHQHGYPAGSSFENGFSSYNFSEVKEEAEYLKGESEYPLYILTIDAGANHFDAMKEADIFFDWWNVGKPNPAPKKKELYKFPHEEDDAIGARLKRVV